MNKQFFLLTATMVALLASGSIHSQGADKDGGFPIVARIMKTMDCVKHKEVCTHLRAFQNGKLPVLPAGNFFLVGHTAPMNGWGQVSKKSFIVLMTRRKGKSIKMDGFNPSPANASETRDVENYIQGLKTGTRNLKSGLHQFVANLSKTRKLFPTHVDGQSYVFMFDNPRARTQNQLHVRQNGNWLYVFNMQRVRGVPTIEFSYMPFVKAK